MYDELLQLINNEQWLEASQKLNSVLANTFDDTLAVIAVTIAQAFNDEVLEYEFIRQGLIYNHANYELYFLLGNYYERYNINQAWLCYENAEFYCDNEEDTTIIAHRRQELEESPLWSVQKCSIILLSYNLLEMTKECIESVRMNNPKSAYELIVIDNNSSDGAAEWLKTQSDIRLICNTENVGFPKGCNQGIEISEPTNDIFLLNNDTIVPPNALFWLRMGLYETDNVGATGSVSNHASNFQWINSRFDTRDEYMNYAKTNNTPSNNPYEIKAYLIGFALLLKRRALNEIGLLDERFSPGNYEDNDICLRLLAADWRILLCHNSFIYHYGHGNGSNNAKWAPALIANAQKMYEKYGFDMLKYTQIKREAISLIHHDPDAAIKVLEIDCGFGMTLSRIKYLWPNSEVYGIEQEEKVAELAAKQLNIIQGNIATMTIPYPEKFFDYIIFLDISNKGVNPQQLLAKMRTYMKTDGQIFYIDKNQ